MTKSDASTRKSVRTTRSSTKRTASSKPSGRAVLGDVSVNSRVTRSSRGKAGQKIQSTLGGQVRRSARKSGDSQQQSTAAKSAGDEAGKNGGSKRKSGSRRSDPKRPLARKSAQKVAAASDNVEKKSSAKKRKLNDESEHGKRNDVATEAVAKGRKRARKSDDCKATTHNKDEGVGECVRSNHQASQHDDSGSSQEAKVSRRSTRESATTTAKAKTSSSNAQKDDLESAEAVVARRSTRATAAVDANVRSRSSKSQNADSKSDEAKSSRRTRSDRNTDTNSSSRTRSRSKSESRAAKVQEHTPSKALCVDFLEHTNHGLVRDQGPFDSSKFTFGVADHDEARREDILEVSNYVTDIYQRLYHAENLTRPIGYVQNQPHLNAMMRAILVDWIVEVHMKFRLSPPTLYLCVNIIDRYLNLASVARENLQLVGVTALLLACKYEEIYPPEVRDCVYITDRAYTRQDVLDMEQEIVKRLEFKMTVPTGHPFLQRFLTITDATATVGMAANYYMERLLQEHDMLDFRPSLIAAAVVCLALNNPDIREFDDLEGPNPGIPSLLLTHTGFTSDEICEVAKKISNHVAREVTTQSGRELVSVKRKYEAHKYQQVAMRFSDPIVEDILFDEL